MRFNFPRFLFGKAGEQGGRLIDRLIGNMAGGFIYSGVVSGQLIQTWFVTPYTGFPPLALGRLVVVINLFL